MNNIEIGFTARQWKIIYNALGKRIDVLSVQADRACNQQSYLKLEETRAEAIHIYKSILEHLENDKQSKNQN